MDARPARPAIMTRYYIRLPDPTQARGNDPRLSFHAVSVDGYAEELQRALQDDRLFQSWRALQESPDEVDPGLGATDAQASVLGRQAHDAIDLVVTTTLSGQLLRQRLRWLAGSHWQLVDVTAG